LPRFDGKGVAQRLGLYRLSAISARRVTPLIIFQPVIRPHGYSGPVFPKLYEESNGSKPRGIGIARNTFFLPPFERFKDVRFVGKLNTVRAKTSDMRAPVNAIVREKVDMGVASFEAPYTKAGRSLAVRYFLLPC